MSQTTPAETKDITLDIVCTSCGGTGLYVGMGERNGAAVVCYRCKGTGKQTVTHKPFAARKPSPASVTTVHTSRGYALGNTPQEGGLPIAEWQPGVAVPADEAYYCPFVYTNQGWCAQPEPSYPGSRPTAPILGGGYISNCKHWANKAYCWTLFHANAPETAKVQVS